MRRLRTRIAAVLVVFPLLGLAQDDPMAKQIAWVGDWEKAFEQAKAENKPVMVCINSIDTEVANNRAAKGTYRDPAFVAATRKFVMVVVSIRAHRAKGPCPRFGVVTCQEHHDCWKELRARHGETFQNKAEKGRMISPQHAWFRSDGTLLRRKEYELTKQELLERMRAVLKEVGGEDGTLPGAVDDGEGDTRLKPLNDKDRAELERARKSGEAHRESRRAALANLMATEKVAVHGALIEMLRTAKSDVKCDLIRALGQAEVIEALETIQEQLVKAKDPVVRSFCAVAIEEYGRPESVPLLISRSAKENDTTARKNIVRALGRCGGGAKDKKAAQALLKRIGSDKQVSVRKHAGLACAHFKGPEASKLVLKKLESPRGQEAQGLDNVRGAVVYTLAYIGIGPRRHSPCFEKLIKGFTKFEKATGGTAGASRSCAPPSRSLKGEGSGFGRSGLVPVPRKTATTPHAARADLTDRPGFDRTWPARGFTVDRSR